MATAAKRLSSCSSVGAHAVVIGAPRIENGGRLDIGARFVLASQPLPSHLVVSGDGHLSIGDGVRIGFGASISCQRRVDIGDETYLGPYISLADSDFHVVGDRDASPRPRPVEIGQRVRIGARVTVLPGTRIGDDVEVAAGSVVGGTVPTGSRIAGVPARPIAADTSDRIATADAVLALVQRTLALPDLPAAGEGRERIPEWDSLGALRILLALEDELGVHLGEDEVLGARRVADLVEAVVGRAHGDLGDVDPMTAVAELVRTALDLRTRPAPTTDREQIPEWDSFGALKILLAAEERLGVSLVADEVAAARTVADLHAAIQRATA